jgi:RNA polymerase sigma-70 factor (ECF subfamily)
MIDAAESLLLRASTLGEIGRYQLEGALQSAHVYRRRTGHANWLTVVQLYDALLTLSGSPVVAINRALAIAEMHGADAALHAMEEIAADSRLTEYQPYWAARAELLARRGANNEACHSYEIAIGLERDDAVRRLDAPIHFVLCEDCSRPKRPWFRDAVSRGSRPHCSSLLDSICPSSCIDTSEISDV